MPFGQSFETEVNNNMADQNSSSSYDSKGKAPISPTQAEAGDAEYSEKSTKMKNDSPPRFSTIFETTKAPSAPASAFESYPSPPKKSGVFIATPLFWAILAVVLFESAVLFGYTIIGLLNNMPERLFHLGVAPPAPAGCDCHTQPAINIAPDFMVPQGQQDQGTVTVTVTTSLSQTPTTTSSTSSTSTSTSTSTSSSTSSANTSAEAAALASNLAGLLHNMTTSTSSTTSLPAVTQTTITTPPGSVVSSTTVLLVDASGHTIPPRSTVTATTVIDEEQAAAASKSEEATKASSTGSVSSLLSRHVIIYPLTPSFVPVTTTLPGSGPTVVTTEPSATEAETFTQAAPTALTTLLRR